MKLDFVFNKNVVKDSIKNCVAGEKTYLIHYGGNFLLLKHGRIDLLYFLDSPFHLF